MEKLEECVLDPPAGGFIVTMAVSAPHQRTRPTIAHHAWPHKGGSRQRQMGACIGKGGGRVVSRKLEASMNGWGVPSIGVLPTCAEFLGPEWACAGEYHPAVEMGIGGGRKSHSPGGSASLTVSQSRLISMPTANQNRRLITTPSRPIASRQASTNGRP